MDKELIKLLELWKRKAVNDLKSIANEFSCDESVTDVICFHAQQASEKYLKMYLISRNFELKLN
ncbi:MAG: HEPN domain-containing protein [Candidatus Cloacimonetes bacterium]|nr:HEPN domain-containing protein [Candidatus Cloacimonadota bacterium]